MPLLFYDLAYYQMDPLWTGIYKHEICFSYESLQASLFHDRLLLLIWNMQFMKWKVRMCRHIYLICGIIQYFSLLILQMENLTRFSFWPRIFCSIMFFYLLLIHFIGGAGKSRTWCCPNMARWGWDSCEHNWSGWKYVTHKHDQRACHNSRSTCCACTYLTFYICKLLINI